MAAAPKHSTVDGREIWRIDHHHANIAFVGGGPSCEPRAPLLRTTAIDLPVAWLRQVHGNDYLTAVEGCAGEGDALITDRSALALAISTADCVPVVIATEHCLAAVHAGWRGIVAGVVADAVGQMRAGGTTSPATAWIGPAIGPCCYEVGSEVAQQVATAAGSREVILDSGPGRPHLDLAAAVASQLHRAGVDRIETLAACTQCTHGLHSYRRNGKRAGRNLTFAWRRTSAEPTMNRPDDGAFGA